jgi:pimeloyl-ACP methyl ester carboxylesterase
VIVTGNEDILTGAAEAELIRQNIPDSQMKIIRRAGHYSPWEQPEEVGQLLRQFFDAVHEA